MKSSIAIFILAVLKFTSVELNVIRQENAKNMQLQSDGAAVDEVTLTSSLHVRPRKQSPQMRRARNVICGYPNRVQYPLIPSRCNFGQTQSVANAAAQSNHLDQYGFGNSAANANANTFNVQTPFGSFGGSAANAASQAFGVGQFGVQNSAAASNAMSFNLPGRHSANFAAANGFANGAFGNNANSHSSAVAVN